MKTNNYFFSFHEFAVFYHQASSHAKCVWVRIHASLNTLPYIRIQTPFYYRMDLPGFQHKCLCCSSLHYGGFKLKKNIFYNIFILSIYFLVIFLEFHFHTHTLTMMIYELNSHAWLKWTYMQKRVIKTRSVEFMPFSLSFFLTLNAVMWFFYGLLHKDFYIAVTSLL